jgi:hypothetical protein
MNKFEVSAVINGQRSVHEVVAPTYTAAREQVERMMRIDTPNSGGSVVKVIDQGPNK